MKLYIAGKITGLDYNEALAKFSRAADLLRSLGHEPVNPMAENGLDGDGNEHPWAEYMKRDIPHLLKCDGIYLLPCWMDSKGATFEKHIAETLEMEILFADQSLCTVCGTGQWMYANRLLLGNDHRLCRHCVGLWYDEGVRDPQEMKRRRLEAAAT